MHLPLLSNAARDDDVDDHAQRHRSALPSSVSSNGRSRRPVLSEEQQKKEAEAAEDAAEAAKKSAGRKKTAFLILLFAVSTAMQVRRGDRWADSHAKVGDTLKWWS